MVRWSDDEEVRMPTALESVAQPAARTRAPSGDARDLGVVVAEERWRRVVDRAADDPFLRLLVRARERADELTDRAVERISSSIAVYQDGAVDRDDLRLSVSRNLDLNLLVLAEHRDPLEGELRDRAQLGVRRASDGLPISDVLRAFRVGYLVLWEAMTEIAQELGRDSVDRLLADAGRIWELLDRVSDAVADSYRETVAMQDADLRRCALRLVDAVTRLPAGRDEAETAARALGLDPAGAFVVAACAGRLAAIDGAQVVVADQPDRTIAVFQPRPGSTRADDLLAARLAAGSVGTVGVGQVAHGLDGAARSLAEACRLLSCARDLGAQVLRWRHDWFRCLVIEAADSLEPLVADAVTTLRASEEARDTLHALLGANGNLTATARSLHVHANTVAYRLQRLQDLCGLDVRARDGLLTARLALTLAGGSTVVLHDDRAAQP